MDKKAKKQGQCSTTRPRKMIAAMERGPGPAVYTLPPTMGFRGQDKTRQTGPAYSIKGRLKQKYVTLGPGPAVYNLPTNLTRHGYSYCPGFTLSPTLPGAKDYTNGPAPDTYNPTKGHICKGKFTFGKRLEHRTPFAGPPPNAYNLPPTMGFSLAVYPSNRGFSLRGRLKVGSITQDTSQSPGPARYSGVNLAKWKASGPKFTIGHRNDIKYKTVGPGPASYTLSYDPLKSASHSFGCKHSEFAPPLITKDD